MIKKCFLLNFESSFISLLDKTCKRKFKTEQVNNTMEFYMFEIV